MATAPLRAQSYTFSSATSFVTNGAGVVVDPSGGFFASTYYANSVYRLSPTGTVVAQYGSSASGSADGTGTTARFYSPRGLALDSAGNLYVADTNNHTIRKISPQGAVTTLAGAAGQIGSADGIGTAARFNYPQGVALDAAGNLYVSDTSNHAIRQITPAGIVSTFAGLAGMSGGVDGTGAEARFQSPQGLATDSAGNLYVADTSNHLIRRITPAGVVTTVTGSAGNYGAVDGPVAIARLTTPTGVALDAAGNIFVADSGSYTIRKISGGVVSTIGGLAGLSGDVAGIGSTARFYGPRSVSVDAAGNIYVADSGVIKIGTPSSQLALTVQPQSQSVGTGSAVTFSVTATGATPIAFQWQKNGTNITGATNYAHTIPAVQSSDAATYSVIVANSIGTLTSNGATLTVLAPVPNDNFANAQTISGQNGSTTGSNNGATGEPGEPLHGSSLATASSVWFKWTAPANGTLVATVSNNSFTPAIGVWRGAQVSALTRVATTSGIRLSFRAQSGTTYYLAVGSSSTMRGNFTLTWNMVLNDDFANAQGLSGDSGSITGNNDGATGEPGEPNHLPGSAGMSTSVWYRWTPSADGVARFETTTNSSMVVQAYAGSSVTALSTVTPSTFRPFVTSTRSQHLFVARAGVTYTIVVGSYYYSTGPFTLSWTFTRAPVVAFGDTTAHASAPVSIMSINSVQALVGSEVKLAVEIYSATPFTVQWRRDGVAIPSATTTPLNLPNIQAASAGSYSAVVSNNFGSSTSTPVVVNVITPPANDNFASAQSISGLNGTVSGTNINATGETNEPVHWSTAGTASSVWYRWAPTASGLAVVDTVGAGYDTVLAVYTGSTLATLTRIIQDDDRGGGRTSQVSFAASSGTTYQIAVGGSTPSARGSIRLNWQLTPTVAITAAPVSQTIAIGGSATFGVQASGAALTYQWLRNDVAIPGATNSTLTLGSVQAGQDASYSVRVSNGSTTVTSEAATLAIAAPATTALTLRRARAEGDLLWSIAGGGGELVTVGSFGVILSSSDNGATWTPRNSGSTGWLVAVTYGAGQFVIVGEGGLILTSPNGREWTRAVSSGTTERLNGVIYADGKYVAVGEHGAAVTSPDGRVWTPRSTPVNTWLHGIAYHAGAKHFATVGENAVVLISPDAVTWTRLPVTGFSKALQQIVSVDSYAHFVAVGEEGMVVSIRQNEFADKDGRSFSTWSAEPRPTGSNTHYIGLAQGAGALFAMGYDGKVITATSDRGPWTTVSSGTGALLLAGMFYNDTLYAVGERETVLQSDRLFNSRLINISTRGQVGTGSNVMISGFVVAGAAPKQVLVRAAGPTLGSSFGLSGTIAAPVLTLFDGQNRIVGSNAGWSRSANADDISAASARVSAFPFGANSADSAILTTLNPGQYTAQVSGVNDGTGLSIVEVYDGDALNNEGSRAINISTRGVAGTGANKMIAGFIIHGASARRVLIRAVGPGLEKFGVGGVLAEPQLEVYNSRALLHTSAGAWGLQANADEIRGSAKAVSAFDLAEGSKDAAMVLTLIPGAWTVQVGGSGNATGVVLVEVYALP